MAFKDHIEREIKIAYEGVFELDNIEKAVARWSKNHGYEIAENFYDTQRIQGTQNIRMGLTADKKGSDYHKYFIKIRIVCTEIKNVKVKERKKQHGNILITISSYIEKDTENIWSKKPLRRILRETYDRFVRGSRSERYEKEIKDDTKNLVGNLKLLLNVK